MSTWGKQSHLPKEALITNSAVPVFTSAGDAANLFVSGTAEVDRFDFTNSTSSTINVTITDASGVCVGGFSNFAVDPGVPNDYQFPASGPRYVGGIRMWAVSAGVYVNFQAWAATVLASAHSSFKSAG